MISSDRAFDLFYDIRQAGGHTKQAILRGKGVQDYLLLAYDPYVRYYITKGKTGRGNKEFTVETLSILNDLATRVLSGHDAQDIVDIHTEEMTARSSELFHMILNKDLRMGMGPKSINKVFPGLIPTHNVMLAKLFDIKRVKFPCFGSPKIDGVRTKYKDGKFYSRNGHPYIGLDQLRKQLAGCPTELDGELTVAGKSFQEGSGLIRNDDLTPNAVFNIFEIPDVKIAFIQRLIMIDDLHLTGDHIKKVNHQLLYSENEVMSYYQVCRKVGYEGAVIKPYDYEYKGTRSYDWMKMKPIKDRDLIVTGIYEGKGKYKNHMGGAHVNFNGQPNDVGGGWSDDQRKYFWSYPQELIGKMIEVHYMEKTDDGNMRHARFIGFREDKYQSGTFDLYKEEK